MNKYSELTAAESPFFKAYYSQKAENVCGYALWENTTTGEKFKCTEVTRGNGAPVSTWDDLVLIGEVHRFVSSSKKPGQSCNYNYTWIERLSKPIPTQS